MSHARDSNHDQVEGHVPMIGSAHSLPLGLWFDHFPLCENLRLVVRRKELSLFVLSPLKVTLIFSCVADLPLILL